MFNCRTHPKLKGPKADSLRHQAELAEFIEAKKAKMEADTNSGVSDGNSEDVEADTQALYENPADLVDEGVVVIEDVPLKQV